MEFGTSDELDLALLCQLFQSKHHVSETVFEQEFREYALDVHRQPCVRVLPDYFDDWPVRLLRHLVQDLVGLRWRLVEVQELGPVRHREATSGIAESRLGTLTTMVDLRPQRQPRPEDVLQRGVRGQDPDCVADAAAARRHERPAKSAHSVGSLIDEGQSRGIRDREVSAR